MKACKTTKRALLMSCISLLLCVSMLVGTTFAWFTDTASTGVNTIKSGNLDLVLEYLNADKQWEEVDEDTLLFNKDALYEPGYTEVAYLKIRNNGSLALKYELSINVADEKTGLTEDGKEIKLSEHLKFGVITSDVNAEIAPYSTRQDAMKAASSVAKNLQTYSTDGYVELKPNEFYTMALVVYMPTTVGNEANHDGENKPTITMGVNVFATQMQYENDSYGSDYDAVDFWDGTLDAQGLEEHDNKTEKVLTIASAEQFAAFAAAVNAGESYAGYTVQLDIDLDLLNREWTPIGYAQITNNKYDWENSRCFAGTFDGQGHTISNLYIDNPETNIQGLFGYGKLTGIKDLTIHNATVTGLRRSAVLIGQNDGAANISNVHITGDVKVAVVRNEAGTLVGRGGLGTVSNVTVDVNVGSYVRCNATSNANWEYVGGVWGHAWPSKATNVSSNIDVYAYASSTGGIGGGCATYSENVTCSGNVTLAIHDTEIHKGTIQCWQTNGSIYGFGVGSGNAASHTNCVSTGTLTIGGQVVTDLVLANVAAGYHENDPRFGSPYNLAGVITITD